MTAPREPETHRTIDAGVTSADVFRIALPMTFAYLSTPLLGLVDTAVIGQLGEAALIGGIAVGALLFDILFSTFNFLRSGTTALTAQALGAGHEAEKKAALGRALLIALGSGAAMVALQGLLIEAGLLLLAPSAAVAEATRAYYEVRIFSAPFALANYAILGWVIGLGRAGVGLGLQTLLNGTNIALSFLFGLHFGWGLFGVALGTLAGEALAFAVGIVICLGIGRGTPWPAAAALLDRAALLRTAAVNRDIMIRTFVLLIGFAVFTRVGARFGDVVLAANAILMNFFLVGGYFLDGLASAAEQMTGFAVGARKRRTFVTAVKLTTAWSFVFAAAVSLFFFLLGGVLIEAMTTAEEVRAAALAFLPYAAATPLAGVLAFEMDGVFIGATWSREMRNMMLASLAGYLAILVPATAVFGNHGLWWSLLAFLLLRGIFLTLSLPARLAATFPPEAPAPARPGVAR
mgnify:CR=1 FL=1|jgi:putative efflux protein, MATE family